MSFSEPMTTLPDRTVDCMPRYEDIPIEFKRGRGVWVRWQQEWFYNGLLQWPTAKEGIDVKIAMRHLNFIQRSWDTSHEWKEAAVAYLASLWFKGVV